MEYQNLNLYHIFYVTAQNGSISAAARELYISQPAVSKAVSRLENILGTALFSRTSRGVRLTFEGQMLYEQLDKGFQAIAQGEESLRRSTENGAGELSIGAGTTLSKYVLLPYLKAFIRENPNIKISFSCQPTNATVEGLKQGTVDIGLIADTGKTESLSFYPIQEIQDAVVTSREYLDALKQQAGITGALKKEDTAKILSHATMFVLDRNNATRQYMEKYLMLHGLSAKQQIEISSLELLIEFAKMGLGVSCIIGSFAARELEEGSLIQLPLPSPVPPRKIGFACKSKAKPSVPVQKFLQLIK